MNAVCPKCDSVLYIRDRYGKTCAICDTPMIHRDEPEPKLRVVTGGDRLENSSDMEHIDPSYVIR